jgi:hypothetical protein
MAPGCVGTPEGNFPEKAAKDAFSYVLWKRDGTDEHDDGKED